MKAFICAASLAVLSLTGCVIGYDTARVERIPSPVEDTLERVVVNEHRAGVALGLVNPNGRYFAAYGLKTANGSEAFTEHSQIATGSITKVFTAELLAALVLESRVELDQDLSEFWPDHKRSDDIRLEQLATHRAGLPRDIPMAALERNDAAPLLALLDQSNPLTTDYLYSNAGMAILGLAMREATGRSLDDLIASRITTPLALTHIGYSPDSRLLATPHEGVDPIDQEVVQTPSIAWGAGGLYASTADLLTFVERHLDPIDSAQAEWFELATDGVEGRPLGWQVHEQAGVRIYHHGGDGNGYQAFIGFRMDNGVGVVLVSNSSADDDLQQIAQHLLMPDTIPLPDFDHPPSAKLTIAQMQPYLGRYRFVGEANTVSITERDGRMYYAEYDERGEEVRTARIYAHRDGGFYLRQIPLFLDFELENGRAVSARLSLQSHRFELKRIE